MPNAAGTAAKKEGPPPAVAAAPEPTADPDLPVGLPDVVGVLVEIADAPFGTDTHQVTHEFGHAWHIDDEARLLVEAEDGTVIATHRRWESVVLLFAEDD